jgi:glyoxylase-like metal-dependent hydrolase (beta-lactamase superfamily II)
MNFQSTTMSRRQLLRGSVATGFALGLASIMGCGAEKAKANSLVGKALPKTPGFYPFNVGKIQGTVLSDGSLSFPLDAVITNAKPTDYAALLEKNFLSTTTFHGALNTAILTVGGKTILIDSGFGDEGSETTGFQEVQLRAAGLTPEAIDMVFLTHAHPDHMNGLVKADGTPLYPNAELVLHEAEYNFWNGKAREIKPLEGVVAGFDANVLPLKNQIRTVKGTEEIISGVSIVEAPGHTPGHCAVLVSSEDEQLLITADAANHHVLFLQNPDYHFSYDFEPELASKTRRTLLEQASADKIKVLAYHFPFPGIGNIRGEGSGKYSFVPVVWGA